MCPKANIHQEAGGLGRVLHAAGTQVAKAAVLMDLAAGTSSSPARRTEGFPFWIQVPAKCDVPVILRWVLLRTAR